MAGRRQLHHLQRLTLSIHEQGSKQLFHRIAHRAGDAQGLCRALALISTKVQKVRSELLS
jgi:hypothetical protein